MSDSAKLRNTRQKALILECLQSNTHKHMTVDDVYAILKQGEEPVGRATVYRYLNQLENEGFVKKYCFMQKKGACFRYLGEKSKCREHYHLVCDICGKISHIEDEELQKRLQEIQQAHGFRIDDTKTIFYGTCKGCNDETLKS